MPDGATWYAKSVTKPEVTIGTSEHQFLNHTFYYPGNVKWNLVTVELVDPVSPDAVANCQNPFRFRLPAPRCSD